MMEYPRPANTPRPGPDCARFADWLPLLTTAGGTLGASAANSHHSADTANDDAMNLAATRAHAQTCAYCQWQLATYTATVRAVRAEFAIPTSAAPFLTLDAIMRRAAALDASAGAAEPTHAEMNTIYNEIEVDMTPTNTPMNEPERLPSWLATRGKASATAPSDSDTLTIVPTPRRNRRFLRALASLVAAAVIVALFGAIFYTLGGNHRRPTSPATHTIHYLGADGHWQVVTQFADSMNASIAQSNPQIIYDVTTQSTVRRSADGGKTWTTLSLPTQDFPSPVTPNGATVQSSPANAQIVLLTLYSDTSNPNCPASALGGARPSQVRELSMEIPVSGGYSCSFQYVSGDGGATWSKLSLVDDVKLGVIYGETYTNGSVLAYGDHIITFAQRDVNGQASPVGRLMGTTDGGLTWAPVDSDIAAAGQSVIQFVATPNGSTLFAVSIASTAKDGDGINYTPTLWRSDDFGAYWTNEGKFNQPPAQNGVTGNFDYLLTAASQNGRTLLYELQPNFTPQSTATPVPGYNLNGAGYPGGNGNSPGDIFVSSDNGHTWNDASNAGVPPGRYNYLNATGALGDGEIVALYNKSLITVSTVSANGISMTSSISDAAYYGWAPGAAEWQQLTPTFDAGNVVQQWITPASADQPETIWQVVYSGSSYTVEKCALT